jgi:hypothetical protein
MSAQASDKLISSVNYRVTDTLLLMHSDPAARLICAHKQQALYLMGSVYSHAFAASVAHMPLVNSHLSRLPALYHGSLLSVS